MTAVPPPLDKPVFVTKPFFGVSDESPLFDEEGDYYTDEDDLDLQEALEQLEYDSGELASASTARHPLIFSSLLSPSTVIVINP